jgi:hypothetical protein
MPQDLSREERKELISLLKELKRYRDKSEHNVEWLLDTEFRRRFGLMIYRAIAAPKRA